VRRFTEFDKDFGDILENFGLQSKEEKLMKR
jgi:hypothetical protein